MGNQVTSRPADYVLKMTSEDAELDQLLDSALEDFDNLPKPKVSRKKAGKKHEGGNVLPPSEEDFMKIFESVGGQGGDVVGLQAELERLASLAGASPTDNKADEGDIASSLAATIAQMTANTAGLGKEPSDEELQAMFANLGVSHGGGAGGSGGLQEGFTNLMPMMEGMMQSLLSKDLLYPAMKELAEKYPDYLADNRAKLSEDEYAAYNKQCELTRRICFKFEEENAEKDTEAMKKERFEAVMGMMQEMQALGHPPKELTGETGDGPPVMPQECSIS